MKNSASSANSAITANDTWSPSNRGVGGRCRQTAGSTVRRVNAGAVVHKARSRLRHICQIGVPTFNSERRAQTAGVTLPAIVRADGT